MKIHFDAPPEDVQIQIVPLIDVIFCILTFFILAALQLTRQQGIELQLPQATTGTTAARELLVVTLTPSGLALINESTQPVERFQLRQILQEYRRARPEGLLVLNASRNALYDEVVQVLDLMREVGGDRVALATQPVDGRQPNAIPGISPTLSPTVSPTLLPIPGQTLPPTLAPSDTYPIPLTPTSPLPGSSPALPSDGQPRNPPATLP